MSRLVVHSETDGLSVEDWIAERIKMAEDNAAEGGPAKSAWLEEIRFYRAIQKIIAQ